MDDSSRTREQLIAELRAAESAVSELKSRNIDLERLFGISVDLMCVTDINGSFRRINPVFERTFGYSEQELLDRSFLDLVHPDDADKTRATVNDRLSRGEPSLDFENRCLTKTGSCVDMSWTWHPVVELGLAYAVGRDLGERKRMAEEAQKFALLVENSSDFIALASMEGQVVYVNQAGRQLVGLDQRADVRALSIADFLTEEGGRASESIEIPAVQARGYWSGEATLRHHETGRAIPVLVNSFLVRRADSGEPIALATVQRDISERKRAEEEKTRLTEQLHQAQKMRSLGQLAGGVAHDINNMLSVVMGSASILLDDVRQHGAQESNGARIADLENILIACERGRDLTFNLLGFARGGKYQPVRVSLNQAVRQTSELLTRTIPKGIAIQLRLAPDDSGVEVEADQGQMSHTLLNLSLNAIDAMGESGTLSFATEAVTLGSEDVEATPDLEPGSFSVLTVSDTGQGMSVETMARAFEPFFTTKPSGQGTGLGLAMVYGTIKNHGGIVKLHSEPGQGTTVTVLLPALRRSPTETRKPDGNTTTVQGSGTVLVVDDEEHVGVVVARMLHRLGYETLVVASGQAAVDLYRARSGEIAFVLLDLLMPVMDGAEVFRLLREISPDARVFICSGRFGDSRVETLLAQGASGFVQKPFALASLSATVAGT